MCSIARECEAGHIFDGNGEVCVDIDECADGVHNCDVDGQCRGGSRSLLSIAVLEIFGSFYLVLSFLHSFYFRIFAVVCLVKEDCLLSFLKKNVWWCGATTLHTLGVDGLRL